MLEDIINKGILEMSDTPFEVVGEAASWGSFLPVRIVVVVSLLLFMVFATDIVSILPRILDCMSRYKANLSLEHSLSTARVRNEVAAIMALPFCLLADRFNFYTPSFLERVRPDLTVLCVIGVMFAYFFARLVFFVFSKTLRLSVEPSATLKHMPYNCFIALVVLMLVTTGILGLFHCPDSVERSVLLWETAFFYFMSIIRTCQFLSGRCNIFATFLYLCALEFAPTGLLIASGFIL